MARINPNASSQYGNYNSRSNGTSPTATVGITDTPAMGTPSATDDTSMYTPTIDVSFEIPDYNDEPIIDIEPEEKKQTNGTNDFNKTSAMLENNTGKWNNIKYNEAKKEADAAYENRQKYPEGSSEYNYWNDKYQDAATRKRDLR